MISVDKPGSPSEILEHYGKKGMKWGVRQSRATVGRKERKTARAAGLKTGSAAAKEASRSGSGRIKSKRTGQKAARAATKESYKSQQSSKPASFKSKFPTSQERSLEIRRARVSTHQKEHQIYAEPSKAKRQKLYASYLQNPDRATALRMTRGEKIVAAIIAVGLPGPGTGAVAGYTGTTLAIRKSVESAQRRRARK